MGNANIEIDKLTVKGLLSKGSEKRFIIPEYQRPYSWEEDEIVTLFEDITTYISGFNGDDVLKTEHPYFLGSVVFYTSEDGKFNEIIDGQQRITTLFLLLRAIYTKLEEQEIKNEKVKNAMQEIEPTLWIKDPLTGKVDYTKTMISSQAVSDINSQSLKYILETGKTNEKKSLYSKNYLKFLELIDEFNKNNSLSFYHLIYVILNKCILLPVQSADEDTALTIFSTLNDRGKPLYDADIFKAKIYNHLPKEKRNDFIKKWKVVSDDAEDVDESLQSVFYYYMFYVRALKGDDKTTTPGLRNYFSEEKYKKLYVEDLMNKIEGIVNFWSVIKGSDKFLKYNQWFENQSIKKSLDILSLFPNEWWKYPVVTYYLSHHTNDKFTEYFDKFLKQLISDIFENFVVMPTISNIKAEILKLNVAIISNIKPEFKFKHFDEKQFSERVTNYINRKIVRNALQILAYDKQDELLPNKWEIEHIFPQTWETGYFDDKYSEDYINERLDMLGNKIPLEKKLNIKAGNNYFSKKQIEYKKSKVKLANEFADPSITKWDIEDITTRNNKIAEDLIKIMKKWRSEYSNCGLEKPQPTEEEKKQIEELKRKGLI